MVAAGALVFELLEVGSVARMDARAFLEHALYSVGCIISDAVAT